MLKLVDEYTTKKKWRILRGGKRLINFKFTSDKTIVAFFSVFFVVRGDVEQIRREKKRGKKVQKGKRKKLWIRWELFCSSFFYNFLAIQFPVKTHLLLCSRKLSIFNHHHLCWSTNNTPKTMKTLEREKEHFKIQKKYLNLLIIILRSFRIFLKLKIPKKTKVK